MLISANTGKTFEKPDSGVFHGVLADVVDLGIVKTAFKGEVKEQPMVRFIWILNVNGKDGKPLSVAQRFNASMHEKANLYKTVKQILNTAPAVPYELDNLIGQTRQLFIVREKSADGTKDYANVQGIAPAQPGTVVSVPADFVRAKNRPKQATNTPAVASSPTAPAVAQGADVRF